MNKVVFIIALVAVIAVGAYTMYGKDSAETASQSEGVRFQDVAENAMENMEQDTANTMEAAEDVMAEMEEGMENTVADMEAAEDAMDEMSNMVDEAKAEMDEAGEVMQNAMDDMMDATVEPAAGEMEETIKYVTEDVQEGTHNAQDVMQKAVDSMDQK